MNFYFQENKLEKIITRHFGETAQKLTEYYLLNGELSFVFEKLYKYNRSIYWDLKAKEENNDTEVFNFEKSEIMEDRSYFTDGKLLHQINNQDCGSPFASNYLLEEQERLLTEFRNLIILIKKNNAERTTMAIIHCGFVPHQNKSINQWLISKRNNPADDSKTKS